MNMLTITSASRQDSLTKSSKSSLRFSSRGLLLEIVNSLAQEHRFRGLYPGRIEPANQFQLREDDRLLDRGGGRKTGIECGHWRILSRNAACMSHV